VDSSGETKKSPTNLDPEPVSTWKQNGPRTIWERSMEKNLGMGRRGVDPRKKREKDGDSGNSSLCEKKGGSVELRREKETYGEGRKRRRGEKGIEISKIKA
jgi:hypothetical protein